MDMLIEISAGTLYKAYDYTTIDDRTQFQCKSCHFFYRCFSLCICTGRSIEIHLLLHSLEAFCVWVCSF